MEKRIRALKAIILVVVMIVELFGVDAVRVVAETINVTGDTTISTEDNRDYAVTDCTIAAEISNNNHNTQDIAWTTWWYDTFQQRSK